jgi:uracil phosphoribosyltransferase
MPSFPGMGYPLVPGYESVGRVTHAGPASGHTVGSHVFVPGARCFGEVRGLFGGNASRLVVPGARVGHVGLYRDEATLHPVEYYFRMPRELDQRDVIVVDPMLATGNSAIAALDRIKAGRPRSLRFVCLVSCPEGIANLRAHHPDVPVFTAAIDQGLNEHGYIVPGLGDAGDRYFGTRS